MPNAEYRGHGIGRRPAVRRIVLQDYRSVAACDVRLRPLTFLVGPNGSGKSNLLDALRFISESLNWSLDYAIRQRGGVDEVVRRGADSATFGMRLDLDLPDGVTGHYAFRVGVRSLGGYEVIEEECALSGLSLDTGPNAHFHVRATGSVTSAPIAPRAMNDRLYLVNASGLPEFRPAYDALTRMGFYNINPDKVRDVQTVDAGALLARDGSNMTTILTRMWEEHPEARRRIEEYLEAIVPGIHRVEVRTFGPRQMLEFMQRGGESGKASWRLPATSVSDGTLRALGVLTALFQRGYNLDSAITLVGIEEPEAALHPAATGILFDSLR
jgi:predicted ATPase